MRSKMISFRLPWDLYDEMERIIKKRKFKNVSRFMFAICIMAIQDDRRRSWLFELANAKPSIQNYVVRHMLNWPLTLVEMMAVMRRIDKKD